MTDRPRSSRLNSATREVDGTVVVEVTGEVDLDTAPRLREMIAVALDEVADGPCIVDLTAVTYLASAGLTALVDATREAAARQEALRIVVDANRPVIRPIEITGLDRVLHLYHSVEEALSASPSP